MSETAQTVLIGVVILWIGAHTLGHWLDRKYP